MRRYITYSLTILLAVALFSSSAFGQSGVLKLLFPDQVTEAIVTDECQGTGRCCMPTTTLADLVCTSEGAYTLNFEYGGDVDSAGEVVAPAHTVNWDTEQYCKGLETPGTICFQNKTVNFSAAPSICCGARPARDCGARFANEVCVNPTAQPEHWEWFRLGENLGDIVDVACAKTQLVSDGNTFYSCGLNQGIATGHPTFITLDVVKSGVDQYTKHGYLCAEPNAGNAEAHPEIIECAGDGRSYNTKQGNLAQIGESHQQGELLVALLGRDDVLAAPASGNFNPNVGKITIELNNTWAGSEDLNRVLFFAEEDTDKYLAIEKSKDKLTCSVVNGGNALRITFDISNLRPASQVGSHRTIVMTWSSGGQFTCSLDGNTQVRSGYSPINANQIFVNIGPRGAQGAQSPMRARLSQDLTAPTLYCAKDAQWTKNLDAKDSITCRAAGFRWTGTKCCSEDEDQPGETYADKNPADYKEEESGACFKSQHTPNGFIVPETNNTILTILGEFYGCQLNESAPAFNLLTDTHTGRRLVNDTNRCTLAFNATRNVNVNFFCSFRGNWTRTAKQDQLFPSTVPSEVRANLNTAQNLTAIPSECCPTNQCWNGITCVADQRNDPNPKNTIKGFRCVGGNWTTMVPKSTFDDKVFGFCPRAEQCLVNPGGNNSANDIPNATSFDHPERGPVCVAHGQNILQSTTRGDTAQSTSTYCHDGSWTSRTNLLGAYLNTIGEQQSPNNYALFCDRFRNTLNFFDYRALPNANFVSSYMDAQCIGPDKKPIPCVNQFCVLQYGAKVAWATTLNKPLNDPKEGFLNAIGKPLTHCDNAMQDDGQFHDCTQNVWYNKRLNAVIFLPTGSAPTLTTSEAVDSAADTITSRMQPVGTFMDRSTMSDFKEFIMSSHMYENLYINRAAQKDLFAFLQTNRANGTPIDYLVGRYVGLNITDPNGLSGCDLIKSRLTVDLVADCETSGTTTTFVAIQTPNEGNVRTVWQDLTAKLRK